MSEKEAALHYCQATGTIITNVGLENKSWPEEMQLAVDMIGETAEKVESMGGELKSRQTICAIVTFALHLHKLKSTLLL